MTQTTPAIPSSRSGERPGRAWPLLVAVVVASGLVWLWESASKWLPSGRIPSILAIGRELLRIVCSGEAFQNLVITFARLGCGFLIALAAVSVSLWLAVKWKSLYSLLSGATTVGLSVPALAACALSLIVLGLGEAAIIVAVAILVAPFAFVTLSQGVGNLKEDYFRLAQVFRLSRRTVATKIIFPQMLPYLLATTRGGLALAWKTVVIAEMLAGSNGVGHEISVAFEAVSPRRVFAWTLLFTALLLLLEYGVIAPAERYLTRWRPALVSTA